MGGGEKEGGKEREEEGGRPLPHCMVLPHGFIQFS